MFGTYTGNLFAYGLLFGVPIVLTVAFITSFILFKKERDPERRRRKKTAVIITAALAAAAFALAIAFLAMIYLAFGA